MNFVILGCGRVGSRLATMLDKMGHDVSIIDKSSDSFKRLIFQGPRVIARIYDPIREDTYHALGLETICPTTLITNQIVNNVLPETAILESVQAQPVQK